MSVNVSQVPELITKQKLFLPTLPVILEDEREYELDNEAFELPTAKHPIKELKSVRGRRKTPPLLSNPELDLYKVKPKNIEERQKPNAEQAKKSKFSLADLTKPLLSTLSDPEIKEAEKTVSKKSKWSFFTKLFKRSEKKRSDEDYSFAKTEFPNAGVLAEDEILSKESLEDINISQGEISTSESSSKDVDPIELARLERRYDYIDYVQEESSLNPDFRKKYKLVDLLGDGAFGFVVVAERKSDKKEFAVKFMMKSQITGSYWIFDENKKIVPLEKEILKQLDHPNIIKLEDSYEDERYFYLVVELHGTPWDVNNPLLSPKTHPGLKRTPNLKNEGNSLLTFIPKPEVVKKLQVENYMQIPEKIMERCRTSCDLFECIDVHHSFPEETGRKIFRQIVDAVKYMNDKGIVHRDLKEENIVIDENYNVKLIDFGAASYIPEKEEDYFKNMNGTPDYAAPEVVLGHPYRGPEAEVWSLGILLYTIVFKQSPFHDANQILSGDIQYPFMIPDREGGVLHLIKKLLTVDVDKRYTLSDIESHPWMKEDETSPYSHKFFRPFRT